MIDLNSLKYGDPKDAVEEVYHISMESVEKFLEKVRKKRLMTHLSANCVKSRKKLSIF